MKKNKKISKKGNNYGKLLQISIVVVILLISLLTINLNHANASTNVFSKNEEEQKDSACNSCKGYSKDTVFNQNTAFVRDAAVDYFTNERLPQKVNDKVKITLGEMIENKLIRYIVDSNGNNCSLTESYVEVTKYENEYLFKINLSCSDINDYILVHKGCADYCGNNVCENKTTPEPEEKTYEYEFKKSTSCTLTDWGKWSEWSTTREATSNNKREETKIETKFETKVYEEEYNIEITYNCNKYEGYTLVGDKCVKSNGKLEEEDADENPTTYNCDKYEGYELDSTGKQCVKEIKVEEEHNADPDPTTYNCDKYEGYDLDSTGKKCVKQLEVVDEQIADPDPTTYNCDKYDGYDIDSTGKKCIKYISYTDTKPADPDPTTYNCDKYDGYNLDTTSNTCVMHTTKTETTPATPVYKESCRIENCSIKQVPDCSSGSCVMKEEKTCTYEDGPCPEEDQYIIDYTCPKGYNHSSTKVCSKQVPVTYTKPADPDPTTYNCDKYDGYDIDSTGKKCILTTTATDEKDADPNPTTYNCDKYDGYDIDSTGKKCILTTTATDEKDADPNPTTYNCKKYPGFKLDSTGKKCVMITTSTDTKPADPNPTTYNCDKYEGYTLYGNKCVKAVCDVCTKDADKEENKVCPDGYTDDGNKCTKEITEEKKYTYYRYSTRACVGGSTETKWSMDKFDSELLRLGFTRTGRTRVLEINK